MGDSEEDLYSSCTMELFPSFLLLVLTLTTQKGFCKPMNSEEHMNMTDTTENRIPSGMSNMTDGDEEKMFFGAQSEKATDGGEKAINGGEKSTNGGENSTNGGEKATNGGEKATIRGDEVKMMFSNRRLHTTEPDVEERAGGIRLTKIDDMWLTDDQLPWKMRRTTGNQLNRQGRVNERYHWPNKILYYQLDRRFSRGFKGKIRRALASLERSIGPNCVKFREENTDDAVQVRFGGDCSATNGWMGDKKYQYMSLADYCFQWGKKMKKNSNKYQIGKIQHEFLHSLGIHHTQTRHDRDDYVTVYKDRVQGGFWNNFETQSSRIFDTFDLPYDYKSVMHYSAFAFANGNRPTIVTTKRKYWYVIGQRDEVSDGDVDLIRKMYDCN